jgi:hypothetical protein
VYFLYAVIGIYFTHNMFRLISWKYRNIQNKANAKKMLEDRDAKNFKFESVSKDMADTLLKSDVTEIRAMLMKGSVSSVELVNFYGARCQSIGRELCLST